MEEKVFQVMFLQLWRGRNQCQIGLMGGAAADSTIESCEGFTGSCEEYNTTHGCIEAVDSVEVYLARLLLVDLDPCLCPRLEAIAVCAAGLREQVCWLVEREEVIIAV